MIKLVNKNKKVGNREERMIRKDEGGRKQANSLAPPGKDLFIPHISRDEGRQMFLGPQVA